MRGHSQFLPQVLVDLGVNPSQAQPFTDEIAQRVHHQLDPLCRSRMRST